MTIPKIIPISGAIKPSWFRSITDRLVGFWNVPRVMDKIPVNPHNRLRRYDQKKDGSCTVFASCGAMCNNTGLEMTNDQIRDLAAEYGALNGARTADMAKRVAEAYECEFESFKNPNERGAQILLDRGYELVVTIRTTAKFIEDALDNGKLDFQYSKGKEINHAIRLKKMKDKYYLVNSWGAYVEKGYHNEYEINLQKMIDNKVFFGGCYFIG